MSRVKSVIVSGATSQIGLFLGPMLYAEKFRVYGLSRKPASAELLLKRRASRGLPSPEIWKYFDIHKSSSDQCDAEFLIHCAGIWDLPALLDSELCRNIKRVIAFSSTSIEGKADTKDLHEQEIVSKLVQGERDASALCKKRRIALTIFRPTMVYGCGMDRNVSSVARLIRRLKFFPLVGGATGKRAPVHAEDLARACVVALNSKKTYSKNYNLSGGSTLSYTEMIFKVFTGLGLKPRILRLPEAPVQFILRLTTFLKSGISADMIDRLSQDLVFDNTPAVRDFGYSARAFSPSMVDLS